MLHRLLGSPQKMLPLNFYAFIKISFKGKKDYRQRGQLNETRITIEMTGATLEERRVIARGGIPHNSVPDPFHKRTRIAIVVTVTGWRKQ